jgi:hypothetical protein
MVLREHWEAMVVSSSYEDSNQEIFAIAGALKENKGLVDLDLRGNRMSDETWYVFCNSLKAHPTLQVLSLDYRRERDEPALSYAELKSRVENLVDMLEVNKSIHTIGVDYRYSEHELFQESAVPYLETNRLRPRVPAIQRIRPIAYRAKVLGRALLATRTDANSFWMLLSGNPEVAFLSTNATTTPAGTTAATVNVAAATATATTTQAASRVGASAANVAT